jgi:hypothetical protein
MTNRLTILTRTGLYLAAASLTAGLACAAAPVASAEWDIGAYDACIATNGEGYAAACCGFSGGEFNRSTWRCQAPPGLVESAPPPPPRRVIVTPVAPGSNAPILPESPGAQDPTQGPGWVVHLNGGSGFPGA